MKSVCGEAPRRTPRSPHINKTKRNTHKRTDGCCCVGQSCPTFVQVFDGDGHAVIENLNEYWTIPAIINKPSESDCAKAPLVMKHHLAAIVPPLEMSPPFAAMCRPRSQKNELETAGSVLHNCLRRHPAKPHKRDKGTHRLPDRRRHRHRQRHRRRHTHTATLCHHGRDTWGLRKLGAQRPINIYDSKPTDGVPYLHTLALL